MGIDPELFSLVLLFLGEKLILLYAEVMEDEVLAKYPSSKRFVNHHRQAV